MEGWWSVGLKPVMLSQKREQLGSTAQRKSPVEVAQE